MKTITQLQKLARRMQHRAARASKMLRRSDLTNSQVIHFRMVLSAMPAMKAGLENALKARRVGLPPFRDATPHKLRKTLALAKAYGAGPKTLETLAA